MTGETMSVALNILLFGAKYSKTQKTAVKRRLNSWEWLKNADFYDVCVSENHRR